MSADDGETLAPHEIVLRGIPLSEDEKAFRKAIDKAIEASLDRAADDDVHATDVIEQRLHDDLPRFVYKRLKRRPMIVPVVVEIWRSTCGLIRR